MLKFYSQDILKRYTSTRKGETKLGEVAATVSNWEGLARATQDYVLLGIPEDVGVRANYGKRGTADAWESFLKSFCNLQDSDYCSGKSLVIAGEIDCDAQMQKANALDENDEGYEKKLGELVGQIDLKVAGVVQRIIELGKTPILIGGGHNNSFGNLKGATKALGAPLNCINFDAHTDLRGLEHRHSGNGFTYAKEHGFLKQYFIFGVHRNFTPSSIYSRIKTDDTIQLSFFEDTAVHEKTTFMKAIKNAEDFCCKHPFALEIDLDAIANMGSSAMSPSGYSLEQCRQFVTHFSNKRDCKYIHLCEGNPKRELFNGQVGKSLAYLVSDIVNI